MIRFALISTLPLLLPTSLVYTGNPSNLTMYVQRPQGDLIGGSTELDEVRFHPCDNSGPTIVVMNQTIDPVDGITLAVPAGDWCAVSFDWDSPIVLDGAVPGATFGIQYSGNATYMPISGNGSISPVALNPFTVTYGSLPSAGAAKVYASVK